MTYQDYYLIAHFSFFSEKNLEIFYFLTLHYYPLNLCVSVFNSLWHIPKSEMAGSHGNLVFSILTELPNSFKVAAPFYNPTSNVWRFQFLYILVNTCYCLFYSSHPSKCEVMSHCVFHLHFPDIEHPFMCLLVTCIPPLEKGILKSFSL